MVDYHDFDLFFDFGISQVETHHLDTKKTFRESNHFQPDVTPSDSLEVSDESQTFHDWINELNATAVSSRVPPKELTDRLSHIQTQDTPLFDFSTSPSLDFHLALDGAGPPPHNPVFTPTLSNPSNGPTGLIASNAPATESSTLSTSSARALESGPSGKYKTLSVSLLYLQIASLKLVHLAY